MEKKQLIFKGAFDVTDAGVFSGYLSVAGNVDAQGDKVIPGAFAADLRDNGPKRPLLWQHQMNEVLGTVHLAEDDKGLYITRGQIVLDVQRGREAYALLKAGAIDGLSIGYTVEKERYQNGARELQQIRLFEGSLVTIPANALARVDAVKQNGDANELKALLDALRSTRLAITSNADARAAEELLSEIRNFKGSISR